MRGFVFIICLGSAAYAQSIVEYGSAAAGGSVGGVAGKKVSDGLTKIFQKIDRQTEKAAKTDKAAPKDTGPLFEVGPAMPKRLTDSVPPPPPPVHRAAVRRPAPPKPDPLPEVSQPAPPPPPEVTAEDLKKVTAGMHREEVLQLGQPASRITMFDDGHLVEIYRYMAKDTTFGVVRLSDGSVSTVEVR